ncbi:MULTISPECIES: hypothetical protein [Yersinia pseudotuberculosis complex]|uniref:Uncharacterized protein n=1 Tax=Yersinia similis TaxID=367190 RepID=A0A0T9R6D5_9GAMM|nr:hypothetical protein [Yersinia similis]CNF62879.1 Uncharacterised protein [Yersinia similis]CNI46869.1 Uncharacterised protein [Yersinia similis]
MADILTVAEAIEKLQRHADQEEVILLDLWYTEDVQSQDETATHDEVIAALEQVVHDFDANSGICWFTLEAALSVVRVQSS